MKKNLILPGNPRYQPRQMEEFFGYDNIYVTVGEVQIANMESLADIGKIPARTFKELKPEIIKKILAIPTTKVDKVEREITKHDIRAWVRLAQEVLGKDLGKWVHLPLTSYDVIDTARILQFVRAYKYALQPSIKEVVLTLAKLVREFSGQIQIGRTHGQHAIPITIGFWLATLLNRILYNWIKMHEHCNQLVGKISGAVGAHNAQIALNFTRKNELESFEVIVLNKLGLKAADISTQILPPEPLAYFLYSCCMLSSDLGQLGRDGRNLMRTEIAEITEAYEKGQVGSSTMAHKRNPINFENLEGTWIKTKNEFGKVLDTLISEHQRDLVGSSVARDFPIILINLQHQLNTLLRKNRNEESFLSRLTVDPEACQKNFKMSSNFILAEPIYISLQIAGYEKDAHKLMNEILVPKAKKENKPLVAVLEEESNQDFYLEKCIKKIPQETWELLHHPEKYTGDAQEQALKIAEKAKNMVKTY